MCRPVFCFLLWVLAFPIGAAPRLSAEDELASQADSRLFSRGEYLARAALAGRITRLARGHFTR